MTSMKTNKISDVWVQILKADQDSRSSDDFMRIMRMHGSSQNYNPIDLFKTPHTSDNCSLIRRCGNIEFHRDVMFIYMRDEEKKRTFWERVRPFIPKPTKIKTTKSRF